MPDPTGGLSMASVGFFGKLPGAGDFVQRRLPPRFVEVWDAHFEQAVHASRQTLGEGWAPAYRASPLWRFVLSPQVCGESAWAGVFGPAQDRVGRCFPMVLAAPVAAVEIDALLRGGGAWFDALARTHAHGQRDGSVDAAGFDALVAALPGPAPMIVSMGLFPDLDLGQANHWRLPLPTRAIDTGALAALWQRLAERGGPCCLWWSEGGGRVPPGMLATRGLPAPAAYAGFLDGACVEGWQTPAGMARDAGSASIAEPAPAHAFTVRAPQTADDVTLPGHGMRARVPVAAIAADAPPKLSVQSSAGAAVVHHPQCALTLVAADAGAPDPRTRAAAAVAGVAAELAPADEAAPGTCALRARLLALHPLLRHPDSGVREDGAVIAARLACTQAELLRIGAAGAWHWRGGRLQPLFAAAVAQPPPGGGLDDLLFGGASQSPAGLGADAAPACDQLACDLLPGDRLVLLAGVAHAQLSPATLAQALTAASPGEAQARLAHALDPTHPRPWPLAVIEVQP